MHFDVALTDATTSSINGIAGEVVTVGSAYENALIREWVLETGNDVWLGITDEASEGTWVEYEGANATGQVVYSGGAVNGVYSNANDLDGLSGENHARMVSDGTWADNNGATASYSYVIQWDASEVLSNFTFSLTDDAGGRFSIDSNTGEITVADGSLIDYETATSHNVDVQVTDTAGNSYTESMAITIDNGLDANSIVPGPQFINEGQTLTFSSGNGNAVSVSDSLAGTDAPMQVRLSVNNGTLALSQTTGLTFVEGTNGSGSFVIDGTESDINAALEGMIFTPNAGFSGEVSLGMTTALAADLNGHYTFDSAAVSGSAVTDQSAGTEFNGTLNGDATVVNDAQRGDVLSLDGDGDSLTINSLVGQPANVTIAAWVNLSAADTNGSTVMQWPSGRLGLRLDNPSGNMVAFISDGTTTESITAAETVAGSGWRHVAFTFDNAGDTAKLYLDGVEIASETFTNSITFSGSLTSLGGLSVDGYDFNGLMDDARVYSRALSADEIEALAGDQAETTDTVEINVLDPIVTTSTTGGGLSINEDGGDDAYLVADDGGAILGGRTSLSFETQFSSNTAGSPGFLTLVSYAVPADSNELLFEIQEQWQCCIASCRIECRFDGNRLPHFAGRRATFDRLHLGRLQWKLGHLCGRSRCRQHRTKRWYAFGERANNRR